MFVLDDLYVSKEVLEFLQESQEPVLDNASARRFAQQWNLNIAEVGQAEEVKDLPKRICSLSEMNLDQAKQYASADTIRAIEVCKDKAALRRALKPLYPSYHFDEYSLSKLESIDPASAFYPVVIKPSKGFFSLGIYPVFNEGDWSQALDDIRNSSSAWEHAFNNSVINDEKFLVESYIEGDEYAVDVYFDQNGDPVVLDILKHDFTGAEDVSDKLYYTSKDIIETHLSSISRFLEQANELLGFSDFPVHVELKMDEQGNIIPIEFNPLRFAGLSTTDISYFAYGFKTYDYFLHNKRPDWEKILAGKEGLVYALVMLVKNDFDAEQDYSFDYAAVKAQFRKVLALRETDFASLGTFGMIFTETRSEDWETELDPILNSNLDEYVKRSQ